MQSVNDVATRLALPARWLLVAGIAYTLATSTLYFMSPPATAPLDAPAGRSPTPARPAPDLNAILARNLFGAADAAAAQAPTETPAVVTRLPLELLGVFVADDENSSAAIISQRGRPGILYGIGEEVPGGATLEEVQSNQVVLRRAGVRETLPFPVAGESLAARTRSSEPEPSFEEEYTDTYEEVYEAEDGVETGESPDAASVRELVDEYREELEEDPSQALEELGVSAVAEGSAEGYRLGDLAQSPYLSQTGLQPGDVILSVNGRPVGDLDQDRLELDNVLAQGSARLEVQRGTRRFFVTASLQ